MTTTFIFEHTIEVTTFLHWKHDVIISHSLSIRKILNSISSLFISVKFLMHFTWYVFLSQNAIETIVNQYSLNIHLAETYESSIITSFEDNCTSIWIWKLFIMTWSRDITISILNSEFSDRDSNPREIFVSCWDPSFELFSFQNELIKWIESLRVQVIVWNHQFNWNQAFCERFQEWFLWHTTQPQSVISFIK